MPVTETANTTSRGPLHDILTAGLPDLRNRRTGFIKLEALADALNINKQSIYQHWFRVGRPNRVSPGKMQMLIDLSAAQNAKDDPTYVPITADKLIPFLWSDEKRDTD